MTTTVKAAGRTHVGLVRRRNEDALYVGEHLVVVADGLGGHVAGDIASTAVVDTLKRFDRPTPPDLLDSGLGQAVAAANRNLRERIAADASLAGMGSTLVAMVHAGLSAVIANVGDSRGYLVRDRSIRRLTDDHVYSRLVADAAFVPNLPEKIARFLDGRSDGRSPDLTALQLRTGDRVLLCSDGLSLYVPADLIRGIVCNVPDPDEAVDQLISAALDQGGPDNITAAIVDFAA